MTITRRIVSVLVVCLSLSLSFSFHFSMSCVVCTFREVFASCPMPVCVSFVGEFSGLAQFLATTTTTLTFSILLMHKKHCPGGHWARGSCCLCIAGNMAELVEVPGCPISTPPDDLCLYHCISFARDPELYCSVSRTDAGHFTGMLAPDMTRRALSIRDELVAALRAISMAVHVRDISDQAPLVCFLVIYISDGETYPGCVPGRM